MSLFRVATSLLLLTAVAGCGDALVRGPLRINEIVSDNDGVWVDEAGETEDLIELVNVSGERVWLDDYRLADAQDEGTYLPAVPLMPGAHVVVFADAQPEQGALHMPFKISSGGERIYLRDREGTLRDLATVPLLETNEVYARFPDGEGDPVSCRYATPSRPNGDTCGPARREQEEPEPFDPYTWPSPYPARTAPLAITELTLRPASFIELVNTSDRAVSLAEYSLRVAPQAPGVPWPADTDGVEITWGATSLAAGDRIAVEVAASDVAAIAATANFEGVVSVFERATHEVVARVDFMAWPERAALSRQPDDGGAFVYCERATRGAPNEACDPIAARETPGRLRSLATPGDFDALAAGGTELGLKAVKVVVDMSSGDVVHFLGSAAWDLHYTFVREQIDHQEHLDRCDPQQGSAFRTGWTAFSRVEYYQNEGRRFLLANMIEHVGTGHHTIEFETGDSIRPDQIMRAFFAITARVSSPESWTLRPLSPDQEAKMREIEGQVPIIPEGAPLTNLRFQLLTPGIGYGVLQYVSSVDLPTTALGPDVIVVTDDVPNDIALVGGLVTESFQTPLSHVNVLSRARRTPNMALRDAANDPHFEDLYGELVRFEVTESDFTIRRAEPDEAEEFWDSLRPDGPRISPRLDATVRGVQPLADRDRGDIPSIGAKAAQLAELGNVVSTRSGCPGPVPVPRDAFAIPVVHFLEHFAASGAKARLAALERDDAFRTQPQVRGAGLAEVRAMMLSHPVEPSLLEEVEDAVEERFGEERVRFRSSSNIEDLSEFNGAGLYTSISGEVDNEDRSIEDAIRTVWASLWNQRGYDEREQANIDQSHSAMGVLVHLATRSEVANAVAVSRNILDPTRGDIYYFNLQIGEASVVNPAPGVTTEELLYRFGRNPRVVYQAQSSLTPYDILSARELDLMACTVAAIHTHFQPLVDPDGENRWFAMDIELKFTRERRLYVKQARPYSFGDAEIPADCREF